MKKRWITVCMAGVMASMLFCACGSDKQTEGLSPMPTEKVEETITPTAEPTETIPEEPTAEPTETVSEEPTAEPTETVSEEAEEEVHITLCQYKGMELQEVDSEEVAEFLHEMLKTNFSELTVVERAAKDGDTVNINYVGKKDGAAFEGGTDDSEEGYNLELGSGNFIDGFEEGLIGAVAGEVRDLELTFPQEYPSAELAGQQVVFTVTVNEVKETVVPELTDEFVAQNLEYGTVAELVLAVDYMLNQQSFQEQVLFTLMENCEVTEYPKTRVEQEKKYVIDSCMYQVQMYTMYLGLDETTALNMLGFESLEALENYAQVYAYETVIQMLILEEIAKVEQLEMTEEYNQTTGLKYATENGYEDLESFEADYGKEMIEEVMLLDYVVDYIISQANIVKAESDGNIQQVE